jgi:5-methylcytosine-specific restriction protein A
MSGWHKTSRHERGYGSDWVKRRERVIQRDHGLCQACLRKGRLTPYRKGQGFAVDHIRPKAKGGTDADENLELLCRECHDAKTAAEVAEAQGRTITPPTQYDKEGRPIW